MSTVELDGEVVSTYASVSSTERRHFRIEDGPEAYDAELVLGGFWSLKTVILTVDGRVVFPG